MKNKKLVAGGLAAAVAGAAFLGANTTALWEDSDTIAGGTITAGNLDVASIGTTAWQDISPDVNGGAGVDIDLDTFKIVPGDVLQSSRDLDVALEGDNMLADLDVNFGTGSTGALLAATEGVTLTYTVVDENGAVQGTANTVPGTATTLRLTPATVSDVVLDDVADYNVKITATFDENTPDQVRTQAAAQLQDMEVTLTQVRPGTP